MPLHVSCYCNHVRIFRDMSGRSLHRRGYRDVMHRAALNEAAASGVLVLSGWRQAVLEAGDGEGARGNFSARASNCVFHSHPTPTASSKTKPRGFYGSPLHVWGPWNQRPRPRQNMGLGGTRG